MHWNKQGLIYKTPANKEWNKSHTQVPIALPIPAKKIIRIYYGTRDDQKQTRTSFIEVNGDNLNEILYEHNNPILELGKTGCFDESGVMPSHIMEHDKKIYFYYLGWNVGLTARYRVSDGLAISEDGGITFHKISDGPILERSRIDPISTSIQSIIIENGIWRAWYMSYTKWERINGIFEPFYLIKYAESADGINWQPKDRVCIDFKSETEGGISVPTVIKDNGIYKMWYSYRAGTDYRKDGTSAYRIGYAESNDGLQWTRLDEKAGIEVSIEGWDSEMLAYPNVFMFNNKLHMLYNGNGFGTSGFGYATKDIK